MRFSAPLLGALAVIALPFSLAAQASKPALTHDDYDRWNSIDDEALSNDGSWVVWAVVPGEGDSRLRASRIDGGGSLAMERASNPAFTADSRWLVATVSPPWSLVDSLRRADDRDAIPGDSLVIMDLSQLIDVETASRRLGEIRSRRLSEEGAWVAVHLAAPDEEESEEEEAEEEEPEGDDEDESEDRDRGTEGTPLVLYDLASGAEHRFEHVTDYRFTDDGAYLFLTRTTPDGAGDGVIRVDTGTGVETVALQGPGQYTRMALQEGGILAAVLTDRDASDDEAGTMSVYLIGEDGTAQVAAAPGAPGVPANWLVSDDQTPQIAPSGSRVYFGLRPPPLPTDPALEDLLDDEVVEVDVWSWHDDRLQPMQLVQLNSDSTQAYTAQAPVSGGPVVPLSGLDMPTLRLADSGDASIALGISDLPYRKLVSWDGSYRDAWVVDVETGARTPVVQRLRGNAQLSPEGRWVYWWDGERRGWYARSTAGGGEISLSEGLPHPVYNELDDRPQPPGSYGAAGWTEHDEGFVLYDRNDVWIVDPSAPESARSLTEGVGRREGLRFRVVDNDPDSDAVPLDQPVILTAFDLLTKESGLYRDQFDGTAPPTRLLFEEAQISAPTKAADADQYLLTRQTFGTFPDLLVAGPDFSSPRQLSDANPQQSEVNWGSAELVEWVSNDGTPLQGILYKPEDFDASREWPMMVYFYERSSDGLHRYVTPSAGGSSINYSFYVSRGYLVFVPDIPYEIGYPGESSLDAVVPGVQSLANQGFVDRDRIGVQGHSWGGYQIAWMITRTNLFAAAEAGAPVANMTSAYGGIRWGTGMSRMFQYERTQSRIGGTLWEAPLLYIENSPLFALDKAQTPLLMMHNDEDTAVPWEQGIELFVALRRLDKPVWLLNYNGEPHGLTRTANRRDWAVRMQQFFDHYLKDAPAPVWMEEGVPALLKGKSLGLQPAGPMGANNDGSRSP